MTVFVNRRLGIEAFELACFEKSERRPKISQLYEGLPIITLKPAAESSQL
jgi:hypothetical protein